jgi:hypothetical protein
MQTTIPQDGPVPAPHPGAASPSNSEHEPCRPGKVGKYLISPLIKVLENGWFASSVSIRSGSGSTTTDRVLRLPRLFRCAEQAGVYARGEAFQWIAASKLPLLAR